MNASLSVVIPKGAEKGDDDEPLCSAYKCRPLPLRNSDTKVIGSVVNRALGRSATGGAYAAQRGLVGGRQLALIIVEFDVEPRRVAATARGAPGRIQWPPSSTLRLRSLRSRGLICSSRSVGSGV